MQCVPSLFRTASFIRDKKIRATGPVLACALSIESFARHVGGPCSLFCFPEELETAQDRYTATCKDRVLELENLSTSFTRLLC